MQQTADPDLWPWIRRKYTIRTIIDIGANNGDFAEFLVGYFKPAETFAFEPLPSCQEALFAKQKSLRNFNVFEFAVSDYQGEACYFQNSNPPSSSMLRNSDIQKTEFPQTSGEKEIRVRVATLDNVLANYNLEKDILIKMDVQGAEDKVILGGQATFRKASCILVEMSFVPMYEGQPLFEEVHELLRRLDFRLAGFKNQIYSSLSGAPLFAHCMYLKQPDFQVR